VYSNVLAIESSSDRATVALWRACDETHARHQRFSAEANRHAENLLPMLTELLVSVGVEREALDAICVGVGPGSFTGLRAGIALAVGLGLGLNRPVLGVSSLTALACALTNAGARSMQSAVLPQLVGALLDARRGEYFFAAFTPDLTPVVPPCVLPRDNLDEAIAVLVERRSIWVAGQAAVHCLGPALLAPRSFYDEPEVLFPSAHAVAILSTTAHATPDPMPQYLREPDVKVPQLPPNPLVSVD
jgi:tRNA threonylcarbamoyladenosine biosynthesis protein TsaB